VHSSLHASPPLCPLCPLVLSPWTLLYSPWVFHTNEYQTSKQGLLKSCESSPSSWHIQQSTSLYCDAQPDTRSCDRRSFTLRRPMQSCRVTCIEAHRVVTRSLWALLCGSIVRRPLSVSLEVGTYFLFRQLSVSLAIDCTSFSNHQRWSCLAMDSCKVGPRSCSLAPYDSGMRTGEILHFETFIIHRGSEFHH